MKQVASWHLDNRNTETTMNDSVARYYAVLWPHLPSHIVSLQLKMGAGFALLVAFTGQPGELKFQPLLHGSD